MRLILSLFILLLHSISCFSQLQSFDILSYRITQNWKKEIKKGSVVYTISNKSTKSWCQLILFTSQPGKGTVELDFEQEWNSLAKPIGVIRWPVCGGQPQGGGTPRGPGGKD